MLRERSVRLAPLPLAVLLALGVSGCSDDDGDNDGGDQAAASSVTVTPALGLVRNAPVRIFQADGSTELASGETDASGVVTLAITGYSGPVVVQVSGDDDAQYYDEAAGTLVPFPADASLRALSPEASGSVAVTPVTEIAYQAAQRQGLFPLDSEQAAPTAFDSETTTASLEDDAAGRYALMLAALAQLGAGEAAPALAAARALAADLVDSAIDGQADGEPLNVPYSDFGAELASALAAFAANFGTEALQTAAGGLVPAASSFDFTVETGAQDGSGDDGAGDDEAGDDEAGDDEAGDDEAGSGDGSGGDLTPTGDGAALAGGNGATGTVAGTAYTYTNQAGYLVGIPVTGLGYFDAFDSTFFSSWNIEGFPAEPGVYACDSDGELPRILLSLSGIPYEASECTIEVFSSGATSVEGRFAATLHAADGSVFGTVTDGYFRAGQ